MASAADRRIDRTPQELLPEGDRVAVRLQPAALSAKLAVPLLTSDAIERTALSQKVLAASSAPIVLLRAPAGFGKTTLMLELRHKLEAATIPSAWLTLDSADNDVGRFLYVVRAALTPLISGLAANDGDAAGPDDVALRLIDAIAAHRAPFTLFLDDFETVQGPAVLGLVRELISHLPAGARIVIGSRNVPELGLGRLRAHGKLVEIEPTQLRFTIDEATVYLRNRRRLDLSQDDVVRLHRSTEGWVAALWLASVSLENRQDPGQFIAGFNGADTAIVEYLLEDVFSRQSEKLRTFLLRTSIVADLTPSLCDRLCGATDSLDVLAKLEREHLFLIPIDGDGFRWRYHSMFAEFLRTQLKRRHPEQARELNRVAANWYLEQDRPVVAIEHWLAAGDAGAALPLLAQHAEPLLNQGRVRLLARWLDPLRERGLLNDWPMLQIIHAWAVLLGRGPRAAALLLEQLDQEERRGRGFDAHRRALRLLYLVLLDRIDEARDLATSLVRDVPGRGSFVRGFAEVALANLTMIAGEYQEALKLADVVRSRRPDNASGMMLALSEAAEGAVDLTQGRLRKATAHLRLAVRAGTDDASGATNGNAMAGVLLAEALYEAHHLLQAERLLTVYIPLIRAVGVPDQLITAHTIMARIAWRRGDRDLAQQLLAELELSGHRETLGRVVASARLERARMLTVEGRIDLAKDEIARCADATLWDRIDRLSLRANEVETYKLGAARCAVHGAQPSSSIDSLRAELDAAERTQRARRALTMRLVLAQAYYRTSQPNKAMRLLSKAIGFAAAEGYQSAFQDEGALLLEMLRELRLRPDLLGTGAAPSADTLQFLDTIVGEPGSPLPTDPKPWEPAIVAPATSSTPLTRKELKLLALVADGLSNSELAERLFVADTTVRTHLRNINAKLGTRSRVEAIAIARKSGLLR
ncbi:LuxR C-terminal-related transcriptional regulator [Rhodopseudomonas palustris]|uniref:LuxR C-terminal-related transcriptional regulator n=1 Tax=Rhodopseudomonas palustris TaxID=1076 RepID=UPI0021F350FA|nr:LuxR C-terminal-related transcriptional regulator [Rhodopseudomonas palustris]UYO43083.1 LuxR C-terminal-related transcriptional regulator [Rhodopseudomonas palustris]